MDEDLSKEAFQFQLEYLIEETKKQNNSILSFILSKMNLIYSFKFKCKTIKLLSVLITKDIPYSQLQKFIFNGIPDDISSLRPLLWKICLNYLSLKPSEWENQLKIKRDRYNHLLNKYLPLINNKILFLKFAKDNPLSINNDSKFNNYFKNKEDYESINKDIERTRAHMNFVMTKNKQNEKETNAQVMNRILYIYSKEHSEVSYIQGMNELLAPFYFCFSNDRNPDSLKYIEHDSYGAFENLMETIKDIFIKKKDNTKTGINERLKNIEYLLEIYDYKLYNHFKKNKIEIQLYGIKWFTLLFTQNFEMPDILRIWDSILSYPDIFDYLNYLMLSPLKIKKEKLIKSDMAGILMEIQNFDQIDIDQFLNEANEIREILNEKLA